MVTPVFVEVSTFLRYTYPCLLCHTKHDRWTHLRPRHRSTRDPLFHHRYATSRLPRRADVRRPLECATPTSCKTSMITGTLLCLFDALFVLVSSDRHGERHAWLAGGVLNSAACRSYRYEREPRAWASRYVDMTRAVVFVNTVGGLCKGAPYGTAQGTDR